MLCSCAFTKKVREEKSQFIISIFPQFQLSRRNLVRCEEESELFFEELDEQVLWVLDCVKFWEINQNYSGGCVFWEKKILRGDRVTFR